MDTGRVNETSLLGRQMPGEDVLPLRVVRSPDGTIVMRCVALRPGARPCGGEWPLVIGDVVGTDVSLEREVAAMTDHVRRYHGKVE